MEGQDGTVCGHRAGQSQPLATVSRSRMHISHSCYASGIRESCGDRRRRMSTPWYADSRCTTAQAPGSFTHVRYRQPLAASSTQPSHRRGRARLLRHMRCMTAPPRHLGQLKTVGLCLDASRDFQLRASRWRPFSGPSPRIGVACTAEGGCQHSGAQAARHVGLIAGCTKRSSTAASRSIGGPLRVHRCT